VRAYTALLTGWISSAARRQSRHTDARRSAKNFLCLFTSRLRPSDWVLEAPWTLDYFAAPWPINALHGKSACV
jgi:hypothetical protein